ncbi:hypothetical protein GCM10010341_39420 [Streptomyces noursei]|nr:hypothetical protein GCM10010341_39420 [Streptomyces noursei]
MKSSTRRICPGLVNVADTRRGRASGPGARRPASVDRHGLQRVKPPLRHLGDQLSVQEPVQLLYRRPPLHRPNVGPGDLVRVRMARLDEVRGWRGGDGQQGDGAAGRK